MQGILKKMIILIMTICLNWQYSLLTCKTWWLQQSEKKFLKKDQHYAQIGIPLDQIQL